MRLGTAASTSRRGTRPRSGHGCQGQDAAGRVADNYEFPPLPANGLGCFADCGDKLVAGKRRVGAAMVRQQDGRHRGGATQAGQGCGQCSEIGRFPCIAVNEDNADVQGQPASSCAVRVPMPSYRAMIPCAAARCLGVSALPVRLVTTAASSLSVLALKASMYTPGLPRNG